MTVKLNISEIFFSLQGEGPRLGQPVVFIRLSGCNLRCKWGKNKCDTPYTSWEPETNFYSIEEVLSLVALYRNKTSRVVLTGGEPTIHPGINELVVQLVREGYRLDLETNGTGPISELFDLVVCSPKLSDSAPQGDRHFESHNVIRRKLHPDVIGADDRIFLKFVVGVETDLEEIQALVKSLNCPAERVYLMSEGVSQSEMSLRGPAIADLALGLGYNYSPRLHIELWGNKRGQ
ncbi:MAG: 7-carboxy-7-deazaguanine synthase QueE [Bdellovibrionales bacterium]|nr:7-carboxy-7-deazaguanine synthase QueE [Bdellovibrionales bacterium]